MRKIPVFYSFHFDNDVMRVQQVRNIGSIEGNSPVSPNEWEDLKRSGRKAIEGWIDRNMKYKRCVVVLIGRETFSRTWVRYEIKKAWCEGRALMGIHIHNLKCPRNGVSSRGKNPFEEIKTKDGQPLSNFVSCYEPYPFDAYRNLNSYEHIKNNISNWIEEAIENKAN